MSLTLKPDSHNLYRMLVAYGRENNFSRRGCECIIDYFDELGEDVKLDVVSLCCEYAESTYDELFDEYGHNVESFEDWLEYNEADESDYEEYRDEQMLEYLNNNTSVLGTFGNSVVYAVF